ncbi:MAG: ROK family protein, partial [Planctomycetes bacterium]|nr:ROK family protein [Planctomycetota bacterium]
MSTLEIDVKSPPILDPRFVPAVLWNRAYRRRVDADPESLPLAIALSRPDGTVFVERTRVLPHRGENEALNIRHVERLLKFMLWQKGGSRVLIAGHDGIARAVADLYSPAGRQAFDNDIVGRKMFLDTFRVEPCALQEIPEPRSVTIALGRNLDGCRIGFDLGGSDRKSAAVIDGKQVHSEEVEWSPYFEK